MKKDKGCTITLPCLQVDEVTCQTCRYFGEPFCSNVALKDAMKRIEQLEAERDAAVKDIPRACVYCKYYISPPKIETHEHGVLVSYCEKSATTSAESVPAGSGADISRRRTTMKTPEEIKKALEYCTRGNRCAGHCPFDNKKHDICQCTGNLADNALAYIHQLEETISLMRIQMQGDCGCCKHGQDMARCNKCLTEKEYHPLWEYEGLPEVKKDDQSV